VTVPDPHASATFGVPLTRRALREARERDDRARAGIATSTAAPDAAEQAEDVDPLGDLAVTHPIAAVHPAGDHSPIFKPPPAPPAPPRAPARRAPARHVRRRRGRGVGAVLAAAAAAILVLGGTAATTSALAGPPVTAVADAPTLEPPLPIPEIRAELALPGPGGPTVSPDASASVVPAGAALCSTPSFTSALAQHDDAAAIAAAGGASAFRIAVAAGTLPCVSLSDPSHVWVVVDKLRPFSPIDYAPAPLALPQGVRSLEGGTLRQDAASALSTMAAAARAAGVGEIALESGYRSYRTQQTSYGNQVAARGAAAADLVSARPGYSEHQSGLAGDVVACNGACGTLDDLAATPQGAWVAAHAWQYGWIVRYEKGHTDVSGYLPEPWHLRYIGTDLAAAYHEGGFHTLEEFFGLPPAPGYAN